MEITHQPREVLIQLLERQRTHVAHHDALVGESHGGGPELTAYEPRRVLETVAVVRARAAERGHVPDAQLAAGPPGTLEVVGWSRGSVAENHGGHLADVHAELEGRTAHEDVELALLEHGLALRPLLIVNLGGVFPRDQ